MQQHEHNHIKRGTALQCLVLYMQSTLLHITRHIVTYTKYVNKIHVPIMLQIVLHVINILGRSRLERSSPVQREREKKVKLWDSK